MVAGEERGHGGTGPPDTSPAVNVGGFGALHRALQLRDDPLEAVTGRNAHVPNRMANGPHGEAPGGRLFEERIRIRVERTRPSAFLRFRQVDEEPDAGVEKGAETHAPLLLDEGEGVLASEENARNDPVALGDRERWGHEQPSVDREAHIPFGHRGWKKESCSPERRYLSEAGREQPRARPIVGGDSLAVALAVVDCGPYPPKGGSMRSSGPVRAPIRGVGKTADRRRVGGSQLAFAAFLAFSSLSSSALAERPSLRFPDAGPAVIAGQRVTVAWEGVSADVDELELLLSVDGGQRYAIRLTRSLDPASGSVAWTVPSFATNDARLRLRFNRGGREEDGEPSAPFRIFVPPASPSSRLELRGCEWWVAAEGVPVPAGIRPVEEARFADEDESVAEGAPENDTPDLAACSLVAADPALGAPAILFSESRKTFAPEPAAPKRE